MAAGNDCTACWLGPPALQTNIGGRGPGGGIMFVGMNPSSQETIAGECFVGPSGKMLDGMLRDVAIDPATVRKTNAVRCEGKPDAEAIATCRPFLVTEIAEQRPKVIVALGDIALQSLCKKSGVMSKRGQSFPLHASFGYECDVYPTFHPAYVLRVPQARDTVLADLRRVRDRNVKGANVRWRWMTDFIPTGQVLAWDIETSYWDDGGDTVTQIAIAGLGPAIVGKAEHLAAIGAKLVDSRAVLVTHNGWRFDVPRLRAATGLPIPWGEDTMVLAYLCDETQPLGLESLAVKYCGAKGWKDEKGAGFGTDEFALYNARDSVATRKLWAVLRKELGPRARIASHIILPALECLDAVKTRGVYIDQAAVESARVLYEGEHARTLAAIEAESPGLNPNSPKQVAAAFEARGYRLKSTDAGALKGLDDPLATAILGARNAKKKLSTYIEPYAKVERAHAEYALYKRDKGTGGTVVGRTSASKPNVQNLDRSLSFFAAPPGRKLVKADYGQMHIRLVAELAQEHAILGRYKKDPRWDAHDWFRARSGLGITRQVAKSAMFSQLYRGTGWTLVEYLAKQNTTLDHKTADEVHRAWHEALPAIRPWYATVEAELRANGYVESLTGMRRHFGSPEAVRALHDKEFEEILKQAVNFKVICLEAHIAMLALGACHRAGLEVVLFVHDSIAVEADADNTSVVKRLQECMINEPLQILRDVFGITLEVPLVVDVEESLSPVVN